MNDGLECTYIVGGGNVFADLGLADPEEALAKAKLAHQIGEIIADRNWTQARAAEVLGIDQPTVSALLRGRLDDFSTDRLFQFLNALDYHVLISVTPKAPSQHRAGITVSTESDPIPISPVRAP